MKRLSVLGMATLVALVAVSAAMSASPRDIYNDYADNSRLDRSYSAADLQAVLANASIQGYGSPLVTPGLRTAVQNQLSGGVKAVGRSRTLPFTGVDLALLTAGAGFLLLLGWGFRRLGRPRA